MEEDAVRSAWTQRIYGYCERTGDAFWGEPLNAVTNIAFIIAGVAAIRMASRMGRLEGPVLFLSANAIVVGIGSFLFHTFATRWAAVMDTTPIMVFILAYFTIAMNRYVGFGWGRSALLMLGFLGAMIGMSFVLNLTLRPIVGGTVSYFPALFALAGVGWWLMRQGHGAGAALLVASAVFAVSLTFRAIDRPVCEVLPLGTHFLWHVLNGLLLWLLIRAVILHGRRPAAARTAAA